MRYARQLCHDDCLAEDLVHDTLVSALRHASQFAGKGSEDAWLRAILRNTFRMWLRGNHEFPELVEAEGSGASPEDEAISNVYRQQLRCWLEKVLQPHDRQLIDLYYGRELGVQEIAVRMHTSRSAVKCRLYRLRRKVKALGVQDGVTG